MQNSQKVEVILPLRTVITLIAAALAAWVIYQVWDILVLFLIIIAIVVAFSPIIRTWEKVVPRTVAIVLLYALLIFVVAAIGALVLPLFFTQLRDFLIYSQSLAGYYGFNVGNLASQLHQIQGGPQAIGQLFAQYHGTLGKLYSTTLGVVGNIVAALTVFITSFYLLLEEKNFQTFLASVVPASQKKRVKIITDRISNKMGSYLRGQVVLMVSIGLIDGIAMAILGVPYALLLGLWAGIMELLPYVGPILGAIPGVFLATTQLGVAKGLIAVLIYFLVQQLENQFLVPRIMGKALGLSPVVIIFSFLIGGKLLGFVGIMIAVPIAAALAVFYEEWRETNWGEDKEADETP